MDRNPERPRAGRGPSRWRTVRDLGVFVVRRRKIILAPLILLLLLMSLFILLGEMKALAPFIYALF